MESLLLRAPFSASMCLFFEGCVLGSFEKQTNMSGSPCHWVYESCCFQGKPSVVFFLTLLQRIETAYNTRCFVYERIDVGDIRIWR